jgi:hypothetical protein
MSNDYSKKYQNFIINYTIEDIQKTFKLESKEHAEQYFYKALARNIVQDEIFKMIKYMIENNQD